MGRLNDRDRDNASLRGRVSALANKLWCERERDWNRTYADGYADAAESVAMRLQRILDENDFDHYEDWDGDGPTVNNEVI